MLEFLDSLFILTLEFSETLKLGHYVIHLDHWKDILNNILIFIELEARIISQHISLSHFQIQFLNQPFVLYHYKFRINILEFPFKQIKNISFEVFEFFYLIDIRVLFRINTFDQQSLIILQKVLLQYLSKLLFFIDLF